MSRDYTTLREAELSLSKDGVEFNPFLLRRVKPSIVKNRKVAHHHPRNRRRLERTPRLNNPYRLVFSITRDDGSEVFATYDDRSQ